MYIEQLVTVSNLQKVTYKIWLYSELDCLEKTINDDIIAGKWKQLKGKARENWGKLTDDDFDKAEGTREYLVGRVQERYGVAKDDAERQVKEFEKSL